MRWANKVTKDLALLIWVYAESLGFNMALQIHNSLKEVHSWEATAINSPSNPWPWVPIPA